VPDTHDAPVTNTPVEDRPSFGAVALVDATGCEYVGLVRVARFVVDRNSIRSGDRCRTQFVDPVENGVALERSVDQIPRRITCNVRDRVWSTCFNTEESGCLDRPVSEKEAAAVFHELHDFVPNSTQYMFSRLVNGCGPVPPQDFVLLEYVGGDFFDRERVASTFGVATAWCSKTSSSRKHPVLTVCP
jgi:hypothetical protein